MPIPMRPMGVGEILDAAVNLYRLHWKTLMLIVAYVSVPIVFLQQLATQQLATGYAHSVVTTDPFTGRPQVDTSQLGPLFLSTGLIFLIQFLLVRPFLTAAIVRATGNAYLGTVPTVQESYKFALSKLGSVLWVQVLKGFALGGTLFLGSIVVGLVGAVTGPLVIVLIVALLVLLVFIWLRWRFGTAAVVLEDRRGQAALTRSWNLAKGFTPKVLGASVVSILMLWVVSFIIAIGPSAIAVHYPSAAWFINGLASSATTIITAPFIMLVVVLLYFDLRIRKEGLDLAVMAQELQRSGS